MEIEGLDPTLGVVRWSWRRARHHFKGLLVTVIAFPLVSAVVGAEFKPLPLSASVNARLEQGLVSAAVAVGIMIVLVLGFVFLRAPYEQRDLLRKQQLPGEDRDATARECGRLAESMYDFLAERRRTTPLTSPVLAPRDKGPDENWRDARRLGMEHDQQTTAGFIQRFGPRIAACSQSLTTLGGLSPEEHRDLRWTMGVLGTSTHRIDEIPALFAAKARQLGWRD